MPRPTRRIEAGVIYHVLNRGNGRRELFSKDGDFLAFLKLLGEALRRFPVDLLAYCLMDNHWHLMLRPRTDASLSRMMAWLTVTHARRHHQHFPNPGTGHLYQGRFKSFPVQSDEHFLTVARYIHANPVRAGLVGGSRSWRWSDLNAPKELMPAAWPVPRPRGWLRIVDAPLAEADAKAVETSLRRGSPFGSPVWAKRMTTRLKLESTMRARGRPPRAIDSLSPRQRRRRRNEEQRGHKSG